MHWQDNPYVLLLLLAAVTSVVQASIAWRRRGAPGGTPLALLAIAAAVWQVGYALELGLDDRSVKLIWAKIQYVGIASIPTLWLAITLQYTDRGLWLTRRTIDS